MLPNFPELKRQLGERVLAILKQEMAARAPLLAQVRKITQHEGKDNSFETEEGDIKRIKYKKVEAGIELDLSLMHAFDAPALRRKLNEMAETMARKQMAMFLKTELPGLADPYFSAEACIRRNLRLDEHAVEERQFMGESYGLQSLVEWTARRLRRQIIGRLWKLITLTSYVEFDPKPLWATYLWRSELGELKQRMPSKPQSWRGLLKHANVDRKKSVPKLLQANPHFCFLFMMVYPHRLRPSLVRFMDECLN